MCMNDSCLFTFYASEQDTYPIHTPLFTGKKFLFTCLHPFFNIAMLPKKLHYNLQLVAPIIALSHIIKMASLR